MKNLRQFSFTLLFILLVSACGETINTPPVSTAKVPAISTIDNAIRTWEDNNLDSYFVDIEEIRSDDSQRIRVVVVDGEVSVAQRLLRATAGDWGEPVAIPLEEAEAYTVDALLARVRQDALGAGEVPLNIDVVFDPQLGYPAIVNAQAMATYNEKGNLVLNREYTYQLAVRVESLFEDIFGITDDPVMTMTQSGGPEVWCDTLRIFENGDAISSNNCNRTMLQNIPPARLLERLDTLRTLFGSLDATLEVDLGWQKLIIVGSGEGEADADTLAEAWELANEMMDLLSQPLGEGLTMLYFQNNQAFGTSMRTYMSQPASLDVADQLYGLLVSPDNDFMVYADGSGVRLFNLETGEAELMLAPPSEEGSYMPRVWMADGRIIFTRIEGDQSRSLGWASLDEKYWHELPTPEGVDSYGCDTGLGVDNGSGRIAITGIGYAHPCNTNPGLVIIDPETGTATQILNRSIATGNEGDMSDMISGGAHTPAWSPDGEWLAVSLDEDAVEELDFPSRLYLVRPDGSELTPISENTAGQAFAPVWGANGRNLYYTLDGVDEETDGIYVYELDSGTNTLLIAGSGQRTISVSPGGEYLAFMGGGNLNVWIIDFEEIIPVAIGTDENIPTFAGWLDQAGD